MRATEEGTLLTEKAILSDAERNAQDLVNRLLVKKRVRRTSSHVRRLADRVSSLSDEANLYSSVSENFPLTLTEVADTILFEAERSAQQLVDHLLVKRRVRRTSTHVRRLAKRVKFVSRVANLNSPKRQETPSTGLITATTQGEEPSLGATLCSATLGICISLHGCQNAENHSS
jgi:plasmid stabilization system protein ParE